MKVSLLRMVTLTVVLAVALSVSAQCGPSGCYVRPRPSTPTASLPAGLHASLARIVHQEGSGTSLGSGALVATVSERSYFLTCAHLFEGPGRTSVRNGVNTVTARVVAIDKQHDLALLETRAVAGRPAETTESRIHGELIACGYGPTGQLRCVRGPVVGRATAVGASAPSLRIRGAVRSGDSGGPVFNTAGRLVAVIWGERGGETFAMGGAPLRRILGRIPRLRDALSPVVRPPASGAPVPRPDPWREQIEQRLNNLNQRRPSPPSLPEDLARHDDLKALSNRWEQRFDRLSTQVRVNVAAPSESGRGNLLLPATTALLTALGVGGPIGVGLFVAKAWLKRRSRRAKTAATRTATPRDEAGSSRQTFVVDTPPPPQQVVSETHYVPYQRDDYARAHQWASEQLVRKFPGSVEMLASLDSLIKQQLNGKETS